MYSAHGQVRKTFLCVLSRKSFLSSIQSIKHHRNLREKIISHPGIVRQVAVNDFLSFSTRDLSKSSKSNSRIFLTSRIGPILANYLVTKSLSYCNYPVPKDQNSTKTSHEFTANNMKKSNMASMIFSKLKSTLKLFSGPYPNEILSSKSVLEMPPKFIDQMAPNVGGRVPKITSFS